MELLAHSPHVGWGEKSEATRTCGLRLRHFTRWSKSCAKAKQGNYSLFPIGKQKFSHLLENRSITQVSWEDKWHHSKCPPPLAPFLPPSFYCWAHYMVQNVPLVILGQLSWLHPLPTSGATPASSLAQQWEKQKSSWLTVRTALQQLKHRCYQHSHPKSKTQHCTRY